MGGVDAGDGGAEDVVEVIPEVASRGGGAGGACDEQDVFFGNGLEAGAAEVGDDALIAGGESVNGQGERFCESFELGSKIFGTDSVLGGDGDHDATLRP